MRIKTRTFLLPLLAFLLLISCEDEFELNAPYKDIWVVYAVLNPTDSVQYVRVSKVFQPESDAFAYAADNDFSVQGLNVRLEGAGRSYQAVQLDSVLKDTSVGGAFGAYTTLYRIVTKDERKLKDEQRYDLLITADSLPDFRLKAHTYIPPRPRLLEPKLTSSFGEKCLPLLLVEDSTQISFSRNTFNSGEYALAYEIRITLKYMENGVAKTYRYGPTKLFDANRKCYAGGTALCYQFNEASILNGMKSRMLNEGSIYQFQDTLITCSQMLDSLNNNVVVEVAAVDSFLTYYITANDPRFTNLNTIRQEFSNITGTEAAVGIFGSISTDTVPVKLSFTAKSYLGIRE